MKDDTDDLYARIASDALIREAKERNRCLELLGVIDRTILIHDDETGLAISSYLATLKKDWG